MEIKELQKLIVKYRDDRDWKQFNNPKDLAISLTLEATEVLEHFQWKSKEEIDEYLVSHKDKVAEELSDVFYWILLMCHDLEIDLPNALREKMKENEKKYPVEKVKGTHKKYTEL